MGNDREGRAGSRGGMTRVLLVLVVILIIIGILGLSFYNRLMSPMDAGSQKSVKVTVPEGSSASAIADILQEDGVIRSADDFRLLMRIRNAGSEFEAGIFYLSPSMTMDDIIEALKDAQPDDRRLTIPEGYNVREIAGAAEKAGICSADEFMDEAVNGDFDFDFMDQMQKGDNRMEGFLFPDTYFLSDTDGAHEAVQVMLEQFDKVYNEEAAHADPDITAKYSMSELLTVASMIERETMEESERPLVASVIYNRLDGGIRLQIDATVLYALGEWKDRVLYEDLEVDSPYNTYKVEGLPAGPICCPSRSAIAAAMNPEDTDYYYYVAKSADSLNHNFASTKAEFERYKQQYLATLS